MGQKNFIYLKNGAVGSGNPFYNGADVFRVNVIEGHVSLGPKSATSGTTSNVNKPLGAEIPIINVKIGSDKAISKEVNNITKIETSSIPSGYALGGVPTFGDGQMNVTLNLPADSGIVSNHKVEFLIGGNPNSKSWSYQGTTQ